MTGRRLAAVLIGSLAFPGLGHALAGRPLRMALWAAAGVTSMALVVLSVWVLPASWLVRLAAAADAYWCHRKQAGGEIDHRIAAVPVVAGIAAYGFAQLAYHSYKIPSSSMYPNVQIGDHVYVDKLSLHWKPVERGELLVFDYPCDPKRAYLKRAIAIAGDTVEVRCNVVYVNGRAVPSTLVDGERCRYQDLDVGADRWIERTCSRYRETLDDHSYEVFHDAERPARERAGGSEDGRDFPQLSRPLPPSCDAGGYYDRPARSQPVGKLVQTKTGAGACEPQLHYVVPQGGVFVMGDNRNNANDSRVWGALATSTVHGRVIGISWVGEHSSWSRFGGVD